MSSQILSRFPIRLSFGGAAISGEGGGYGFGAITEKDAIQLCLRALECGITVFDTAPIYGFGLSEQRIGKAFEGHREKVFLISKSGVTWGQNKRVNMTNDPMITQKMLEQSLKDLKTDYIDLYFIHWPDQRVDIRKPLEVLRKAQEKGQIKHIGLCNTHLEDLERAQEVARVEVVQSEFSFLQYSVAQQLFDYLQNKKIEFMSWGTLGKGIITGTVTKGRKFDSSDCRSWAPWWKASDKDNQMRRMEKVHAYLRHEGYSGLELALGFNLSFPQVASAIVGARNIHQLETLMKALNHLPTEEIIQEATRIYKS